MKVEESLNVTFDKSPPPTKLSPLIDDVGEQEAIENNTKVVDNNNVEDEAIEVDKVINIKESKNHPLEQVIGNINQRTLRSQAQNYSNFFCFISTIEPKNVNEALGDENNDETYAPVARLKSIRILLALACANDFKLYQIDVKSAILNGFINEEVYIAQPPGFIDFEKPNCVYKLKKALYSLKQAPKAWGVELLRGSSNKKIEDGIFFNESKYIKEMLKKFGLKDSKTTKTSMSTEIKLTKDDEADSVDITKYQGTCIFSKECLLELLNTTHENYVFYQRNLPNIQDVIHNVSIPSSHQNYSNPSIVHRDNLLPNIKDWELIRCENFICVDTHKSFIDACSGIMLYNLQICQEFNLAYYIAHNIENVKNRVDCPLPYVLLLTRLYKYVLARHLKLFCPHSKL
ncbi:retrovirus-related pol polyprotein from transposon TNT 1-94 [Tanacetum coccineum]